MKERGERERERESERERERKLGAKIALKWRHARLVVRVYV